MWKNVILSPLILILLSSQLFAVQLSPVGDGKECLTGPVKSVLIQTALVQADDASITSESKTFNVKTDFYDQEGRPTMTINYRDDGSVSFTWEAKYDAKGTLLKEQTCEVDGSDCITYLYSHESGRKLRVTETAADGAILSWEINIIDEKGNRIKSTRYSSQGSILSTTLCTWKNSTKVREVERVFEGAPAHAPGQVVRKYDSQGRLSERRSYESSTGNALLGKSVFSYDSHGWLIEESNYSGNGTLLTRTSYIKHETDSLGNWIKRMEVKELFSEGGGLVGEKRVVTDRTISYYETEPKLYD